MRLAVTLSGITEAACSSGEGGNGDQKQGDLRVKLEGWELGIGGQRN